MQFVNAFEEYNGKGRSAVTFGKFDGLHRGHEKLVSKVSELGKEEDILSVVCSFDMTPMLTDFGLHRHKLMTRQEKINRLEGRVDYLVSCSFTRAISQIPAEDFIRDIICGLFRASYVVVGVDFTFGYKKRGDIHMLKEYEEKYGYKLIAVEKARYKDREISSTYIREAIQEGNMELAETLLGYPYTILGNVEHGAKLGRALGFPTINVPLPKDKVLPPFGVYFNRVKMDGKWYNSVGNLGVKPTVTDNNRKLFETFLLDYDGQAYEKDVEVNLCKFVRPEMKFPSVESMKERVDQDIQTGIRYFKNEK